MHLFLQINASSPVAIRHFLCCALSAWLMILCGCVAEPTRTLPPARKCFPAKGTTGSPSSIEEAVHLINGLPRPTTIACFVESLDRPLAIHASTSEFSAQPAADPQNPRVFIFSGGGALVMTVVPDGNGAALLEFGQFVGDEGMSIKGELVFPILEPVAQKDPYSHLPFNDSITTCGFCHRQETQAPGLPYVGATMSQAIRPLPRQRIPVEIFAKTYQDCIDKKDPSDRCGILRSIFLFGEVEEGYFLRTLPTFIR